MICDNEFDDILLIYDYLPEIKDVVYAQGSREGEGPEEDVLEEEVKLQEVQDRQQNSHTSK